MIRETLLAIPQFPVRSGFCLRSYLPGDEDSWLKIHLAADAYNKFTPQLFQEQFGTDQRLLAERQFFLIAPNQQPVGTATAWFGKEEMAGFARVHWVAIMPDYQGQGLSKPLMAAVCNRLRDLGHERAYLNTSSQRIAAIHLYQRFGFKPWIRDQYERAAWETVFRNCNLKA